MATLKLGMKQGLRGQTRFQRQGDLKDNILLLLTLQHCCPWLGHCSAGDRAGPPPAVKVACTPYFGLSIIFKEGENGCGIWTCKICTEYLL